MAKSSTGLAQKARSKPQPSIQHALDSLDRDLRFLGEVRDRATSRRDSSMAAALDHVRISMVQNVNSIRKLAQRA